MKQSWKKYLVITSIIVVVLASLFYGSGNVKYVEVTSQPEYARVVGQSYRTAAPMWLYGIAGTGKDGWDKIEHYSLKPFRIDGPEVLAEKSIEIGTVLSVKGVERCGNCFEKSMRLRYEITIATTFEVFGPVYVDAKVVDEQAVPIQREVGERLI